MIARIVRDFKRCYISFMISVLLSSFVYGLHGHERGVFADELVCTLRDGWTQLVSPEEENADMDASQPWKELLTVAAGWDAYGSLYVGSRQALYLSTDCGQTWTTLYEPRLQDDGSRIGWTFTEIVAGRNGRLYGSPTGISWIQVSRDGGVTWHDTSLLGSAESLALSPSDPDTVYVFGLGTGAVSGARSFQKSVMRTTDAGQSWERMTPNKPDGAPIVDPTDSSNLYVIGHGIVQRSIDGASSFEPFATYSSAVAQDMTVPKASSMGRAAMNRNGTLLWFIGISGDMYVSEDRGLTWKQLPHVPFGGPVRSVSASPYDPALLFVVEHGGELWAFVRKNPR